MIDFVTIEAELGTALAGVTAFKSIETSHIRDPLPVAQMPAMDISAHGHTDDNQDPDSKYKVQCIIVIRRSGAKRKDNAEAFKALVKSVCAVLETYKGTSFAAIRRIQSNINESDTGDGSMIRIGFIQLEIWARQ